MEWEKICANHKSDVGLRNSDISIANTHTHIQTTNKKQTN